MPPTPSCRPTRRRCAAALALLLAAAAGTCVPAAAAAAIADAEAAKFDRIAFERAVAGRAPVVIYFHADWCGACKLQKPVVAQLLQESALRPVRYFAADHDRERLLRSMLRVSQPGTFIVFRNGYEVARSTGRVSRGELRDSFLLAVLDPTASDAPSTAKAPAQRGVLDTPDEPSPAAQTPFTPFSANPPPPATPPVKRP